MMSDNGCFFFFVFLFMGIPALVVLALIAVKIVTLFEHKKRLDRRPQIGSVWQGYDEELKVSIYIKVIGVEGDETVYVYWGDGSEPDPTAYPQIRPRDLHSMPSGFLRNNFKEL
jgi:hypothetical protein